LFLIPSEHSGSTILEWDKVEKRLPWGIFFLLGGGLALSLGMNSGGLTDELATSLEIVGNKVEPEVFLLLATFCCVLLTQFATNTATVTIFMAFVPAIAQGTGVDPRFLMIPTALAGSFAFFFPISASPNMFAFQSGYFTIFEMFKVGFGLVFISMGFMLGAFYLWIMPLLDVNTNGLPCWAVPSG
jgi:sodium-dependent dicarboxylate transporter 2/3/5